MENRKTTGKDILHGTERRNDGHVLVDDGNAMPLGKPRCHARNRLPIELDRPVLFVKLAAHDACQGGLSRVMVPDHRVNLTRVEVEVYSPQRIPIPVEMPDIA